MPLSLPAAVCAALGLLAIAVLVLPGPAHSAAFIDAAGRRVILPEQINRIMPAEPNAEVLVFVLAPNKLAGMGAGPGRAGLPRGTRPTVLRWEPRTAPDSMARAAMRLRADLIIDAGPVTPAGAAFADAVQHLTGIPYILVDSSFERTPQVLHSIGAILGVAERAEDLRVYAEHAIAGLRGRLLVSLADARPRVYYALGSDGLTTALPGSATGAAIDEAGAINVAAPLGYGIDAVRISREQLSAWDPEIIITEKRSVYNAVRRNRAWRGLAAVRNQRVYLEPSDPYGWIEHPSGVNRLIGLSWLSTLFYPDATHEDLRTMTCDFYDKFYRIRLTNAQVDALVVPAGAPPPEAPRPFAEPLVGLNAAPPSPLPPGIPGVADVPTPLPPGIPGITDVPTTPLPQAEPATALCTVPGAPAAIPGMYTAPPETGVPAPLPGPLLLPDLPPLPGLPDAPPSVPPGFPGQDETAR
jgi:iron complex transport system substrate-binding protein